MLQRVERAAEVHPDDGLEVGGRHLLQGPIAEDARVVDEDVEASAPLHDRPQHRAHGGVVRHVAFHGQRRAGLGRQRRGIGPIAALRVGHEVDHAGRAFGREGPHQPRADAAGAAGDEHDLAGEVHGGRRRALFAARRPPYNTAGAATP
jgi:hypothetical protein